MTFRYCHWPSSSPLITKTIALTKFESSFTPPKISPLIIIQAIEYIILNHHISVIPRHLVSRRSVSMRALYHGHKRDCSALDTLHLTADAPLQEILVMFTAPIGIPQRHLGNIKLAYVQNTSVQNTSKRTVILIGTLQICHWHV